MRKLIVAIHMSLDGFVEGPHKDMSWMQPDEDEQWNDLFDMLQNVDLFLLGRGMWKDYRNYWQRALKEQSFSANEVKYAKLAEKTPHIVFSDSLKDAGWNNTTVLNGPLAPALKKLKSMTGKDIQVVGGAKFAGAVIDTGLVDEYRLMIEPTILGKGKRLFDRLTSMYTLSMVHSRMLANGIVVMHYKQLTGKDQNKIEPGKRRSEKPVSEKKSLSTDDFFAGFGRPAANALRHAGISSAVDLAKLTEKSVLAMHGIGPASLPKLKKKLKQAGLDFKI